MHLIIDTSTERGIIIIAQGGCPLFTCKLPFGYQSSRTLFSEIERGFLELKITACDLKGIAVAVGPGLFTGIRVGVSAAKGLAYARKLPLVGLNSLSGFTLSTEGRFYSAIDGRSRGVYIVLHERVGNKVFELEQLELLSYEEVAKKRLPLVGPCFARIKCKQFYEIHPDPDHLALLALSEIKKYLISNSSTLELSYH